MSKSSHYVGILKSLNNNELVLLINHSTKISHFKNILLYIHKD